MTHPDGEGGTTPTLPTQIHHMWQRRKDLKRCTLFDASGVIRTWKWIVLFLKAGSQSKQFHAQNQRATTLGYLQQAERAVQAHKSKHLFGAVKKTLLQEHTALVKHCEQLFAPAAETPPRPGLAL